MFDFPDGTFYVDASHGNVMGRAYPCFYTKKCPELVEYVKRKNLYMTRCVVILEVTEDRLDKWKWIDHLKAQRGEEKCLNHPRRVQTKKNRRTYDYNHLRYQAYQQKYHKDLTDFFMFKYGMSKTEAYKAGHKISEEREDFLKWKENHGKETNQD